MEPLELARSIADTLEDKKGEDILLLDLHNLPPLTDYFVVCSGTSDRTIGALMDAVVEATREKFDVKPRLEALAGKRLTEQGTLIIVAKRYRTQEANRLDAFQRLVTLVRRALQPPKARKATRPSAAKREQRLQEKKQRGELKRLRRGAGQE